MDALNDFLAHPWTMVSLVFALVIGCMMTLEHVQLALGQPYSVKAGLANDMRTALSWRFVPIVSAVVAIWFALRMHRALVDAVNEDIHRVDVDRLWDQYQEALHRRNISLHAPIYRPEDR